MTFAAKLDALLSDSEHRRIAFPETPARLAELVLPEVLAFQKRVREADAASGVAAVLGGLRVYVWTILSDAVAADEDWWFDLMKRAVFLTGSQVGVDCRAIFDAVVERRAALAKTDPPGPLVDAPPEA